MSFNLSKDMLSAQYEDLRSVVLCSSPRHMRKSQGLSLFLRQGMIGWLKGWSRCSFRPQRVKDGREGYNYQELPFDLRGQITIVLANMVLNVCREDITVC